MSIIEAKKELYRQLKGKKLPVTGAGIKTKNGSDVIVIFLTGEGGKENIPSTYKGNKVVTEVTAVAKAMKL